MKPAIRNVLILLASLTSSSAMATDLLCESREMVDQPIEEMELTATSAEPVIGRKVLVSMAGVGTPQVKINISLKTTQYGPAEGSSSSVVVPFASLTTGVNGVRLIRSGDMIVVNTAQGWVTSIDQTAIRDALAGHHAIDVGFTGAFLPNGLPGELAQVNCVAF